ncbi:MAG TPA: Uma2 family endonuclease [Bryobacteraceae bacterium]|jgi:Uma2 family endonuclease|nr:Uma2 family endonuclease [Bryobacteraceae bacterium]
MGTLLSEDTYRRTFYKPDREYADGVGIERNAGEQDHSWLQAALSAYLFRRRKLWEIEAYVGPRHFIRPGRYMIPDVCVIRAPRPAEKVFDKPPLIWIEILSPEDRPIRVNEKIRELREFGVPNIWVIDPETFEAEVHTPEGSTAVADGILRAAGTAIEVPLGELDRD